MNQLTKFLAIISLLSSLVLVKEVFASVIGDLVFKKRDICVNHFDQIIDLSAASFTLLVISLHQFRATKDEQIKVKGNIATSLKNLLFFYS